MNIPGFMMISLKKYIIIQNVGHNNRFPLDITNGTNKTKNMKQIPTGKLNKK
jgi:hypothetical protein